MSQPVHEPCEHCGERGCVPAMHAEAGSELAWLLTTGGILGATILGLLAVPAWVRRFPRGTSAPGHPKQRHHQDRIVTAVLSALVMATLSLTAVTVAVVEATSEGRTGWRGASAGESIGAEELAQILELLEDPDAHRAQIARRQLLELAPTLSVRDVGRLRITHDRLADAGHGALGREAIREALRVSEQATASLVLAELYEGMDHYERERTIAAVGRCASTAAVREVLEKERRRYRTPWLSAQLNIGCVAHVAEPLLGLAAAHPQERPAAYTALARACDHQPAHIRREAGRAIADSWRAQAVLPPAERDETSMPLLAHALACADEERFEETLATLPETVHEATHAELRLVAFRRGRVDFETLMDEAAASPSLRALLDAHYEGSAPWQDAVVMTIAERMP